MTTLELILKKDLVRKDNRILRYSDFTSGDEFSIMFTKNNKVLSVYDSINTEPEEFDLDNYDYIVINHYIHYTINEMIDIYKEYVNSERIINSSKKFTFNFNEKMGLEKLKDCLTDNWRKIILENMFGSIAELEVKMQNEENLIDMIDKQYESVNKNIKDIYNVNANTNSNLIED